MNICRNCKKPKLETLEIAVCPICENQEYIGLLSDKFKEKQKSFLWNEYHHFEKLRGNLNPSEMEFCFKNCINIIEELKSKKILDEFLEYKVVLENELSKNLKKSEDENIVKIKTIDDVQKKNLETLEDYQYLVKKFEEWREYNDAIREQVIQKNKEEPELSHLQCLYYVLIQNGFNLFASEHVEIKTDYGGECVKCGIKIPKGEKVFWNPANSKIKHVNCKTVRESREEIFQLCRDAIKNFEKNDYERVKYYVDRIDELETGNIFKNQHIANYLSEILGDAKKFNLLTKNIAEKIVNSAEELTPTGYFEKFEKECILEISKQVQKSEGEVRVDFEKILRRSGNKISWREKITHYYELTSDSVDLNTPVKKSVQYIGLLEESERELWIVSPYVDAPRIYELMEKLSQAKHSIRKLRILTHYELFFKNSTTKTLKYDWQKILENIHGACKQFNKLYQDKIEFNYKIVLSDSDDLTVHDRYFFGEVKTWTTSKGLTSFAMGKMADDSITKIKNSFTRKKFWDKYDRRWNAKEALDMSNEALEIIEKKLKQYDDRR